LASCLASPFWAKNAAKVLRSKVVLGEDPAAEKKTKRMVPTFMEFAADHYLPFIEKNKRSWESDVSLLNNHLLPRFGKLHLDKINQQAVIDLHHGMKDT
jgi:Phage integrase, N-terminal SAM-like domain